MKVSTAYPGRRKAGLVRVLSDNEASVAAAAPLAMPAADEDVLDSYSKTVSGAVEKVRPTVVNIRAQRLSRQRRGAAQRNQASEA